MEPDNPKGHHGNKWMPILYATYFGMMQTIAHKHGYALAVHGSFTRDMDLIAVPWVTAASPHLDLVQEIYELVGDQLAGQLPYTSVERKPHGRTSYTIMTGGGGYLDLAIMKLYSR